MITKWVRGIQTHPFAYLYHALDGKLPVIGVDSTVAREHVASMHDPHRIPILLKAVDLVCRTAVS